MLISCIESVYCRVERSLVSSYRPFNGKYLYGTVELLQILINLLLVCCVAS